MFHLSLYLIAFTRVVRPILFTVYTKVAVIRRHVFPCMFLKSYLFMSSSFRYLRYRSLFDPVPNMRHHWRHTAVLSGGGTGTVYVFRRTVCVEDMSNLTR